MSVSFFHALNLESVRTVKVISIAPAVLAIVAMDLIVKVCLSDRHPSCFTYGP